MVQSPKGLRALGVVLIASFLSGGALEIHAAQANATMARAQALQPNDAAKTTQPAEKVLSPGDSYDIAFNEFKLKNGLRVLLAEDPRAPTFSICVTYNVGSRDENPGRTGFSSREIGRAHV